MFLFVQEIRDTLSVFMTELKEQRELVQGILEMAEATGLSNQKCFDHK